MRHRLLIAAILCGVVYSSAAAQLAPGPAAPAGGPQNQPAAATSVALGQNIFHVKYISEGAVYLDGGLNAGLAEGMILHIVHADPSGGITEAVRFTGQQPIADLRLFTVADSSSAGEVVNPREDLAVGDIAYLDVASVHLREDKRNAAESENYPVVVTFSYGDPLDEELRAATVSAARGTPPIQNQLRGRFGWDLGYLTEPGGASSRQVGLLIDADMSRIGGTHWNFTGFWRGNVNSQNSGKSSGVPPTTLNDLINRTYHLGLFYENPDSIVTMGIGRLYLPYAPSLSTIDGAYFGERLTHKMTAGVFGGSTPDPTSWSYAPNQHIAGVFLNYQGGDFDHVRYTDTFGLAMTSIGWHVAREFVFLENNISFGRTFSVYNSLQADKARTVGTSPTNTSNGTGLTQSLSTISYGTGLTQSFTTVRFQPIHLLTFDLNHNYLRNLPTFDPVLISTGLLDQYLFQGLSGGVRLDLPYHIGVSTDIGRSNSSTDTSNSWNQMYGLTFGEIGKTGLLVDLRYTKFNSSFGQGNYQFVSVSRSLTDRIHLQLQGGVQHLASTATGTLVTTNTNSRFLTSTFDWAIGPRYFFEALLSWNNGTTMNYMQTNLTFGYRFGGTLRK